MELIVAFMYAYSMNSKPFFIIIYGSTGVGKTDTALRIAQTVPAEIINIDVGQFYAPFSIGTAKPEWEKSHIKHHFFDIINEPCSYSVTEYRNVLLPLLKQVWDRGKVPIIVGGSGFYIKSLLFPPYAEIPHQKIDLTQLYQGRNLWELLYEIDPLRASHIDKGDSYRIVRALEIWHKTGILPTLYAPRYIPPADYLLIYLTRERDELNKIINDRVTEMIKRGWLDEVEQLRSTAWEPFIKEKKLIGYSELLDYLNGERNEKKLAKTVEIIQDKTRQYAKRQRTFWRMLEKEIMHAHQKQKSFLGCLETVNLTKSDINLYINELLRRLSYFIGYKNDE